MQLRKNNINGHTALSSSQLRAAIRNPYPYQERAIEYIKSAEHPAVFMQMRLGKTFCTIRALTSYPGRILIVAPKSVLGTWQDELEAEGISNYAWFASSEWKRFGKTRVRRIRLPRWVIMNYEAVTRLDDRELALFDCVVVDESVRLKDPQAKTTRFFLEHFRQIKKRICLSGEPAPNTPLEYFTQFKFLKGNWMRCDNFWEFRNRYFGSDRMGWNWWPRSTTKDLLRKQLKEDAFVLTRKQAGVAAQKVYQTRLVEMPVNVRREYTRMENEFVASLPDGSELQTKYVLPQLSYLMQMAGGHLKKQHLSDFKINELVYLLETELKNEQVVVWSWFTWEINRIKERLKNEGIEVASIMGETSLMDRRLSQEKFQKGSLRVLCMQVATGKYGLNLSKASTAVYFSNSLKPDDRNQSEYRIEHNEKKNEGPLLYVDLVTKNTVDEDILKVLKQKKQNSAFFLGDIIENMKERHNGR